MWRGNAAVKLLSPSIILLYFIRSIVHEVEYGLQYVMLVGRRKQHDVFGHLILIEVFNCDVKDAYLNI